MTDRAPPPLQRAHLRGTGRLRPLLRRHGAVLLFALAVSLLIALSLWWLYFLSAAIEREEALTYALLERDVQLASARLAEASQDAATPVPIGMLASDPRLEVVPGEASTLRVQPTAAHLAEIARRKQGKQRMITGEGALLTSLLIVVVAMLFRLIVAERRFRNEMQEFLGRVTHEMKTPLSGIKAVLQTISATPLPQDQLKEVAALALVEVEREEHLIQNLLLAQRMRLPDQHLHDEAIALQPLLERFVAHRREILGQSVTWLVDAPDTAFGRGDPTALWTILENLTDNAIKYGGTALGFAVRAEADGWSIALTDNGIGFDPGAAEALFEAFERQSGDSAARHGTGLGLHISRALARRMGGELTAQSSGAGQGATFVLRLLASV